MKFQNLRKKYPKFIYRSYSYKISGGNFKISFFFEMEPDIQLPERNEGWRRTNVLRLKPEIVIENIDKSQIKKVGDRVLNNLVFNLGMIEMISYWKATCSPIIEIRAGYLNKKQINWWKDLIIKGMGQFFYENKIDFTQPNFLRIISKKTDLQRPVLCKLKNKFLVPIGGGKDSIVTLELLKRKNKEINGFLVNPSEATKEVLKVAKIKNPIVIKRKIDPTLLKLNQKGYLNGHTPFTAVLSFLSVFCAILFDYKNIVFSNEKSANEGNLIYLGKMINHQWSKSSEFERKFKNYCQKYLAKNINYFSLLRPYTELKISRMFLKYPQYFSIFSSCNLGQKTGQRWCGNCPKCLFVYMSLYPFLGEKELLEIFGKDIKDIFENKKLLPVMKGLLGQGRPKPFECVGTKKESRKAFQLSKQKAQKSGKIPYLLTKL